MGKETMETLKKINKRKLRDEIACIGLVILGVIIFICAKNRIAPGIENPISLMITSVVSVGYFAGPGCSILGICGFFEVRNKKYSRKRRHRK
ncbi:MAG: hypothetical protein HFJ35_04930 [Clostridia bacterium]|nr:hypothetical protein [Clostridia bacterium]